MKLQAANHNLVNPCLVALDSTLVTNPENKGVCNLDRPGFFRQLAANGDPACAGICQQHSGGAVIEFDLQSVSLAYIHRAVAIDVIDACEMPAVGKHFYILSFRLSNKHPGFLFNLGIQELEIV